MRGLKHIQIGICRLQDGVASFTDAWIETNNGQAIFEGVLGSHLLQMRGLKQDTTLEKEEKKKVASFTDAWIETLLLKKIRTFWESHLLQMRGLKPETIQRNEYLSESHLLQMRGLKL